MFSAQEDGPDVYLSGHEHEGLPLCYVIKDSLENAGLSCIIGEPEFQETLPEACKFFFFILTPNYLLDERCRNELSRASDPTKVSKLRSVVPVLPEGVPFGDCDHRGELRKRGLHGASALDVLAVQAYSVSEGRHFKIFIGELMRRIGHAPREEVKASSLGEPAAALKRSLPGVTPVERYDVFLSHKQAGTTPTLNLNPKSQP